MIEMPDFEKAWDYENAFYLTCEISRLSKTLAHWELFRMSCEFPGAFVECGVFKGVSIARFAAFRQLLGNPFSKKIIGFDSFGSYPETTFEADKTLRDRFIEAAGSESISTDQLMRVLAHKKCEQNVELVAGNICDTVPQYCKDNPHLRISLLNLDTDVYEPAVTILEHLYPRIVNGGILALDNYGTFPGESKAVDEYFAGRGITLRLRNLQFSMTPCYVVVE